MSKFQGLFPEDYDKRTAPPKINEGKPNDIKVALDIVNIPRLDEKDESLVLEIKISHHWTDTRLNTSELEEPMEIEPDAISDFWVPDSYFSHAKAAYSIKIMTPTASLQITPNKTIKYAKLAMLTIGCPMSFHQYPMDQQTCYLKMQSFGYDITYFNYSWLRAPHLKTAIHLDNHDVEIVPTTFDNGNDEGEKTYPGLGVRIRLTRHLGFHLTQTYIPSIIFVTVAWLSFHVPSDVVPGRMVLCVTTLLTLTAMFNSVRSLTPQVSYMKAIDLWVFVCLIFVFSALAEYGYILHLTSRSSWQKRIDKLRKDEEKILPVELLSLKIFHLSDNIGVFEPNTIERLKKEASALQQPPSKVSSKEERAYCLEYIVKFLYPLAFIIFNIAYWTYYLSFYYQME